MTELEDEEIHDPTEQIVEIARRIPKGSVISYGELGALCDPPISGYIAGRILGRGGAADIPWWRIMAKTGELPVGKKNPDHAKRQRALLEDEGIEFTKEGRVDMSRYRAVM